MLAALWADPAIKAMYEQRDRLYNINDGTGYFWDAIPRVYQPSYLPTEADLLRIRIRTVGFDEATFTYKGNSFHVVDLGGQRPERRKWLEALAKTQAVIFVSSLCECVGGTTYLFFASVRHRAFFPFCCCCWRMHPSLRRHICQRTHHFLTGLTSGYAKTFKRHGLRKPRTSFRSCLRRT
jgi:hypothetical protein